MFKIEIIEYQNTIFYPAKNILDIPYYELIKIEATVRININNIVFFEEKYFPILEFMYQFDNWKNSKEDIFEYHSIESLENPLISFQVKNKKCYFDSVWKASTTEITSVELTEVISEMNDCRERLLKTINSKSTGDGFMC